LLLNTRIIPALEEEGFHVLPVAHAGSDLAPRIDAPAERLLHHTLLSLLREIIQTSEVSQDL
jgi:hypothetical protein